MQTDDLIALTLHMALLSLMAVGGISAILPDMQRFVVEVHPWISAGDFADAYALAQSAPGPNMMFVTLLGWQLNGWLGAVAVTIAMLLPPVVLTLIVTHLSEANPESRLGKAIRGGLGPITIGLTLASGWILAQSADSNWQGAALTLATVVFMLRTKLNPVWLILVGAIAGMSGIV